MWPFTKMRDWRRTYDKDYYLIIKETSEYVLKRKREHWIDMNSGDERWTDANTAFYPDIIERKS
jgi:hypothetical protein